MTTNASAGSQKYEVEANTAKVWDDQFHSCNKENSNLVDKYKSNENGKS